MKLNKILIRCITSVCAFVICLSLFVVSASAESSSPDFFDFDSYATYEPLPDTDEVKAIIELPEPWYISYLSGVNSPPQFGRYADFEIFDSNTLFSAHISPFGSLWNYYDYVGSDTHILDLSLMPKDFVLYGGFEFEFFGDFVYLEDATEVYVICYDQFGEFVDIFYVDAYLSIYDNMEGYVRGEYEFVFDSSNFQYAMMMPAGFAVQFNMGNFTSNDYTFFTLDMKPFEMDFFMSNAFINNRNDKIVRDKLSNMEKQLGDIDNKLDSAINGTPEQNQQAQDAVDDLNSNTDRLGQIGDAMASVDKPTIDSNKISAGSLVPQTSLILLSSPFQALWENKLLLAMLSIVVSLVLVSWVFFGKKG